ncbi:MAG TPA: serine/threonine-protein kinase [Kofleriaceae bacterium]|nr:serine/threonine-protein kinase [Kofleriaceae bacterium]
MLGQGGSGIVYDATWGPRRVALKVLHPTLVGTGKERAQFFAEAQKLQNIAHPAVVKVFAVGQLPDARPYLAMERLEGETLAQVVARGPLPLAAALALFDELCGAVGALHDQGLVHRDLKPENVFVVAGRHAVLLDFGIAKELAAAPSTTTQEGNVRGTPAYMAPERFFGQPAGVATDVYELALVLYAMLAGRLPWDVAADPEARLVPRSLCELARVPEALDVEIRRALSTRAQNRPVSAGALFAAVREAAGPEGAAPAPAVTAELRGGPMRAPAPEQATPLAWAPTVAAATTQKRARRRRVYAGAAVAVVVAGGGAAWWRWHEPHRVAPASRGSAVANPGSGSSATVEVVSTSDPWNATITEPVVKDLPLVEAELTPETYRAEAAAAIQRLPADTRVVITAQMDELRAQDYTASLLGKIAKQPTGQMLERMLAPCLRTIAGDSEWIAFGAPSIHDGDHGTFVLRGRWTRHDVESCFGKVNLVTARDGAKLIDLQGSWIDFIDDHTVYASAHGFPNADAVHALVKGGAGPTPHTRDLVSKLSTDRSIAIVIDGKTGDDFEDELSVPRGSDLYGWMRVDKAGVAMELSADTHDPAIARRAADKIRPRIVDLFDPKKADVLGKLEVEQARSVIRLHGTVSALMVGLVSGSLDL